MVSSETAPHLFLSSMTQASISTVPFPKAHPLAPQTEIERRRKSVWGRSEVERDGVVLGDGDGDKRRELLLPRRHHDDDHDNHVAEAGPPQMAPESTTTAMLKNRSVDQSFDRHVSLSRVSSRSSYAESLFCEGGSCGGGSSCCILWQSGIEQELGT
ncbi:hypothetical protein FF1_027892 [Malus domestica]